MIHVDPKDVPEITSWEVEAALRGMKNGTTTGNYYINTETFKAGEDTISKTFALLYTKCLSERRISTDGDNFQEGKYENHQANKNNRHDCNYSR